MVYTDCFLLRPAGQLKIAKAKTYTYLLRKYTGDPYLNEDGEIYSFPHGASIVISVSESGEPHAILQFPEDDVTELFNKYGANRCLEWNINQ